MIGYIKGKIVHKSPARMIVENNGIGYVLNVSLQTSESVGEEGEDVKLFVHQQITDEEIQLYGFSTEEEKKVFELLLGVPGIGPRVALRILSGMSINELYNAIVAEDAEVFTKVPGVGRKTGERLIVELKQRVEKIPTIPGIKEKEREIFVAAVEALTVLGYKRKEATAAINKVMKEKKEDLNLEEIIKEALKKI
ncbi:Holliday junction branch migration protein RuvA [bacterium]|nr:Holliday junction branch migration protein RuvA [bacterium]